MSDNEIVTDCFLMSNFELMMLYLCLHRQKWSSF